MAHTTHKIAVGGGDGALAFGENAHVPAQAGAAGRGGNHRAGLDEIDVYKRQDIVCPCD